MAGRRQPGAAPGDQGGEKLQKQITAFLRKQPGDGVKKSTAKTNNTSSTALPSRRSNRQRGSSNQDGNGGKKLQDQIEGMLRKTKGQDATDPPSTPSFDASKIQVYHQKTDVGCQQPRLTSMPCHRTFG